METLEFKLNLQGIGWDNVYPQCNIYINDDVMWTGQVVENQTVEFTTDVDEDIEYELKIQYYNRNTNADVLRDLDGKIIKNRQFEIVDIYVDDIELDYYSILYSKGTTSFVDYNYVQLNKQDPENYPLVQTNNTILGAECTWSLKFTTPFYIWLLENL